MHVQKKYSRKECLNKLYYYCNYRERCHKEIQEKLYQWGYTKDEHGDFIIKLMEEGFLNEERFARSYVRGKFNYKHWGKNKIRQGLKAKGIHDKLIAISFEEIDDKEYLKKTEFLIRKKIDSTKALNYKEKNKILHYMVNKGYETQWVLDALNVFDI
jgi:regulatory protein